ncbi:MAG: cell division protein FtsQ/DivIB [Thermodesulfobacteriota bacterium]
MFRLGRKRGYRPSGRLSAGRDLGARLDCQRVACRAEDVQRRRAAALRGLGAGIGLLGRAAAVLGFMAFSGLLLLGGYAALAHGGAFAVREAVVLGTDNLSRLEILRAAQIGADSSLLSLPVAKVEARIRAVPWVEWAGLERDWPHGVRITVRERRPVLLALVEDELYYLGADMKPFTPVRADETLDLPAISGLSKADLLQPDDEMLGLLRDARDLIAALPAAAPALAGRLSEVHLDRVWGLSLVFNDLTPTVRLGLEDHLERLAGLRPVIEDLQRRGELMRALLIDLGGPRRAVVRLGRGAA